MVYKATRKVISFPGLLLIVPPPPPPGRGAKTFLLQGKEGTGRNGCHPHRPHPPRPPPLPPTPSRQQHVPPPPLTCQDRSVEHVWNTGAFWRWVPGEDEAECIHLQWNTAVDTGLAFMSWPRGVWHEAMVLVCLSLALPLSHSPLHILALCGSEPCQKNYSADAHTGGHKSVLELAGKPSMDLECASGCTWSTVPGQQHGQQPISWTPTPESRGSVDLGTTTMTPSLLSFPLLSSALCTVCPVVFPPLVFPYPPAHLSQCGCRSIAE